jgi:hypothetical protein
MYRLLDFNVPFHKWGAPGPCSTLGMALRKNEERDLNGVAFSLFDIKFAK